MTISVALSDDSIQVFGYQPVYASLPYYIYTLSKRTADCDVISVVTSYPFGRISPVLTLAYFITATFFFLLFIVSEKKYSLICFTFTGTLNQLHFILLFIFHLISFFSFFMSFYGVRLLACLLVIVNIHGLSLRNVHPI